MIRHAWCVLLGALLVTACWTAAVGAQPPRNYPCAVQDWDCVNGKLITLEARADVLQRELAFTQEAWRQARDAQTAVNKDLVWSVALDAAYFQLRRYGLVK